ncbi:hypothetical protein RX328_33050 [Bradyrhizobium sp. sBnM-33]|nr:hypothetical protein [Bradyrhizobium sp. sBnM-33]WOH54845.1 hypothetical protein RX328_33050 [Bradyrhizobium sp. sBnM-33]
MLPSMDCFALRAMTKCLVLPDGSPWPLDARFRRAVDLEDAAPDDERAGAGNRAEDAFRLSMIGSGGDPKVFWSTAWSVR